MFPDSSSTSNELFQRGLDVMPGGITRESLYYSPYPVYAASGQGTWITDVDGVERLDCVNCNSAAILGHGHPAVVEAVQAQAAKLMSAAMPTENEIRLAELIVERFPSIDQVRFTNSGAEALMFALRLARAHTGKAKVARMEGTFHGTYDQFYTNVHPTPDNWGPIEEPAIVPSSQGLSPAAVEEVVPFSANDIDHTRALLERHADELACVVIDPLPSYLGFLPLTQEFLQMLREVTAANNILLVIDEVFSFRLGFNGGQGVFGIKPDLTALGKIIGGGLPVGAVGGSANIMALFDQRDGGAKVFHSGTFSGNPMTTAAGIATLSELSPALYDHLNQLGDHLRDKMRRALADANIKATITGMGSVMGLFFFDQPYNNYRELAMAFAPEHVQEKGQGLFRHMINNGVFHISKGVFILSTPMTLDDMDCIVETASTYFRSMGK